MTNVWRRTSHCGGQESKICRLGRCVSRFYRFAVRSIRVVVQRSAAEERLFEWIVIITSVLAFRNGQECAQWYCQNDGDVHPDFLCLPSRDWRKLKCIDRLQYVYPHSASANFFSSWQCLQQLHVVPLLISSFEPLDSSSMTHPTFRPSYLLITPLPCYVPNKFFYSEIISRACAVLHRIMSRVHCL